MRGEEVQRISNHARIAAMAVGQERAAGLTHRSGQMLQHPGMELVEGRDQEADHMGKVGTDRGCRRIAPVAEILDRALDLLAVRADGSSRR